ncbi:MAG: hypothetical protein APF83_13370 [Lutibacter sp. BRH_c52]|nr:MAG: hypothetical protein APF83_13370 [Lutibacter sp. BRH_c52]
MFGKHWLNSYNYRSLFIVVLGVPAFSEGVPASWRAGLSLLAFFLFQKATKKAQTISLSSAQPKGSIPNANLLKNE